MILSANEDSRYRENIHLMKHREFGLGEPQVGFELHAIGCCFALNLLAMSEPARLLHQKLSSLYLGVCKVNIEQVDHSRWAFLEWPAPATTET